MKDIILPSTIFTSCMHVTRDACEPILPDDDEFRVGGVLIINHGFRGRSKSWVTNRRPEAVGETIRIAVNTHGSAVAHLNRL